MKVFYILSLAFSLVYLEKAYADGSFNYAGRCASSAGSQRVRGSVTMQNALRSISRKAGRPITIYSCYRSQGTQNGLLSRRGCRPYGRRNCSGSTARKSQHTYGIAADIKPFATRRQQCQIMSAVRGEIGGGRGGVGTYSGGSGHFDLGNARSWNICRFLGRGNRGGGMDRWRAERARIAAYNKRRGHSHAQ